MRKHSWLLIVLFACVTILFSYTACTYDYFVDETNYLLFVPEVKDKTVDDCRVLVYNAKGELVGEKYATKPFDNNERMVRGEFGFRLPAGEYKIYCYTNTDGVSFVDTRTYDTSGFQLLSDGSENGYKQPSDMFFQKLERNIIHPGVLNRDTADIKRYTGRITVRFTNFPGDVSRINKVQLRAENVATMQFLQKDTLTTRMSAQDEMIHLDNLDAIQISSTQVDVDHRYFPSIDFKTYAEGFQRLNFRFMDSQNEKVIELPVDVLEEDKTTPWRLLHGQRIFIEVNNYFISKITVVGWDEDIRSGGIIMQ